MFLGENAAELATGSGKVVLERLREVDTLSLSLLLFLHFRYEGGKLVWILPLRCEDLHLFARLATGVISYKSLYFADLMFV